MLIYWNGGWTELAEMTERPSEAYVYRETEKISCLRVSVLNVPPTNRFGPVLRLLVLAFFLSVLQPLLLLISLSLHQSFKINQSINQSIVFCVTAVYNIEFLSIILYRLFRFFF